VGGSVTDRVLAPLTGSHLLLGTGIGFTLTIALLFYAVNRGLKHKRGGQTGRAHLPSAGFLIYEAAPYLAHGSLYMVFILLPHVLGWFGAVADHQGRLFALTNVEAGLLLSLIPVTLVSGVAEHTLRQFWIQAREAQASSRGQNPDRFGQILLQFYRRQLSFYLAVLGAASLVAVVLFFAGITSGLISSWTQLSSLEDVEYIFLGGLIAYYLVGWGLFNCMFCLTLARPNMALRAVLIGLAVTLLVGLPLSLESSFAYSALSFVAGAAAFVIVSSGAIRQLFRSASYYYETSF
jgi:hypothetical protein